MVPRKKVTPKGFWGMAEGLTEFSSPPRKKYSFFVTTICFVEARGRRWIVCDSEAMN